MTYPRFSYVVDDMTSYLMGGIPASYINNNLWTFTLLNGQGVTKDLEVQWVKERVKSNVKTGIRTILVTTYDLISPHQLKSIGIESDEVYIVRMVPGGRDTNTVFNQPMLTINDDINALDILLTDIIGFSNEKRIRCEIIIYTFSSMIHTHGWKRVYSLMISKLPILKSSMVQLSGIYYPESHVREDVLKFEKMTDKILDLSNI
jgi:hypothetical protein